MATSATLYLTALALTYAVELPLLVALLRGRATWPRILGAGFLASAVTHPLLWFVWPRVVPLESYALFLATGEGLVVAVEAVVIWALALGGRRAAWRVAVLASVAVNGASCAAGLLLQTVRLASW
jgi:hypothetical protein